MNPRVRNGRRLFAFFLLAGLSAGARAAPSGFLTPARGERLAGGDSVEVRWSAPCDGAASETELVLSLDGGRTFPIRITPEMSPCAGSFRWRVPDVGSSRARLALRTGSGEESDDERLTLVSDEFSIAEDGDDGDELLPGAREVWTRQALDGEGTEDPPADSMAGSREDLVAPSRAVDAHEPPSTGLIAPVTKVSRAEGSASSGPRPAARRVRDRSIAPLPLRL